MQKNNLANELEDALGRLRRSKLFGHSGPFKGAEKHVLFKVAFLNCGKPVTPSELASSLSVSMSAVTHQINSLESLGLIERVHSNSDRRVVAITLSRNGKDQVKQIHKEFHKKIRLLANYLGEKDTNDLVRIIKKISDLGEKKEDINA